MSINHEETRAISAQVQRFDPEWQRLMGGTATLDLYRTIGYLTSAEEIDWAWHELTEEKNHEAGGTLYVLTHGVLVQIPFTVTRTDDRTAIKLDVVNVSPLNLESLQIEVENTNSEMGFDTPPTSVDLTINRRDAEPLSIHAALNTVSRGEDSHTDRLLALSKQLMRGLSQANGDSPG